MLHPLCSTNISLSRVAESTVGPETSLPENCIHITFTISGSSYCTATMTHWDAGVCVTLVIDCITAVEPSGVRAFMGDYGTVVLDFNGYALGQNPTQSGTHAQMRLARGA